MPLLPIRLLMQKRKSQGVGRSCASPGSQSGNRLRADIVAAAYRAQRFAVHVAPLDRFALLVRGEDRFATEFDALGFCAGQLPDLGNVSPADADVSHACGRSGAVDHGSVAEKNVEVLGPGESGGEEEQQC